MAQYEHFLNVIAFKSTISHFISETGLLSSSRTLVNQKDEKQ